MNVHESISSAGLGQLVPPENYRNPAAPYPLLASLCASHYAALGYAVIPWNTAANRSHKSAEFSGGARWGATAEPEQVSADRDNWPDSGVSIRTGRVGDASALVVLDLDVKNGQNGPAELSKLEALLGRLPTTLWARTPSGGWHLFFSAPANAGIKSSASQLAPGVDVRADGGVVHVEPSERPHGVYRFESASDIAALPAVWVERLQNLKPSQSDDAPEGEPPAVSPSDYIVRDHNKARAHAVADLQRRCDQLAAMGKGGRRRAAWDIGKVLGHLCGHNILTTGEIESAVMAACEANGANREHSPRDMGKRVRKGIDECKPPYPRPGFGSPDDVKPIGEDDPIIGPFLKRKREEREAAEAAAAPTPPEPAAAVGANVETPAASSAPPAASTTPPAYDLKVKTFKLADALSQRPREWLYGELLSIGLVSLTTADPKVGKSFLALAEALSLTTGRPLMGEQVARPVNVLVINLEDDMTDMRFRIAALMQECGVDEPEIGDRLHLAGFDEATGMRIVAAKGGGKAQVVPEVVAKLQERIRECGAEVVIVDPAVKMHAGNENDASDMDLLFNTLREIAARCRCSIHAIHHASKSPNMDGTPVARGSSAIMGAVRVARVISHLTDREAGKFGLSKDEAKSVRRVTMQASNHGSDKGSFYVRLRGVALQVPGVQLGYPAAVMERWHPPKDVLTDEQVKAILQAIGDTTPRADVRARGGWIGHIVGVALDIDTSQPDGIARATGIVAKLAKDGYLVKSMAKGITTNGSAAPVYSVAPEHAALAGFYVRPDGPAPTPWGDKDDPADVEGNYGETPF